MLVWKCWIFGVNFLFGNSAGKVNIGNELWKSATKRWLLKTKEKNLKSHWKKLQMEKAIEFYLSLNLNFKNSAEICDDFLKWWYFHTATKQGIFKKIMIVSDIFWNSFSAAKKRTLENFSGFFGVKNKF